MSGRPAGWRAPVLGVGVLVLALTGCRGNDGRTVLEDDSHEPAGESATGGATTTEAVGGEDRPPPQEPTGERSLSAALEAARAVELPVPRASAEVDFGRPDAVFAATGSRTFGESLDLVVTDAVGDTVYWQRMRTDHQADPIGYHMTVSMGGSGELWAMLASYGGVQPGVGSPLEVVRIGDRYWTRQAEAWEGPVAGDAVPYVRDASPIRAVSGTFRTMDRRLFTALGPSTVHGRATTGHRIEKKDDQEYLVETLWSAFLMDLPSEPLGDCCDEGEVQLWVDDERLVVRAEYRIVNRVGLLFRATMEVGGFDEPVEITVPS